MNNALGYMLVIINSTNVWVQFIYIFLYYKDMGQPENPKNKNRRNAKTITNKV